MKGQGYFIVLVLAGLFFLSFSASHCWAVEKIYQMGGEITAVDLYHNTVVVEVPLGEELYTVGGTVSPTAVLKKGGKSVGLAHFRRGDRVIVKWEVAERGHIILMLKSR